MRRKSESEGTEVLSSELRDKIRRVSADTLSAGIEAAAALVAPHLADAGKQFPLKGKTVYLASNAPKVAQRAAGFLNFVDSFREFVKDVTTDDLRDSAFYLGMSAAEMLGSCIAGQPTSKVLDTFLKDQEARRRGGSATTKWTPEMERAARKIFAEEKRGKTISNEGALQRTKMKLLERGYKIGKTLLREKLVGRSAKR